eukprot:scaffold309_cov235-Pinguiococcus_pyrenoidosus.AAC.11
MEHHAPPLRKPNADLFVNARSGLTTPHTLRHCACHSRTPQTPSMPRRRQALLPSPCSACRECFLPSGRSCGSSRTRSCRRDSRLQPRRVADPIYAPVHAGHLCLPTDRHHRLAGCSRPPPCSQRSPRHSRWPVLRDFGPHTLGSGRGLCRLLSSAALSTTPCLADEDLSRGDAASAGHGHRHSLPDSDCRPTHFLRGCQPATALEYSTRLPPPQHSPPRRHQQPCRSLSSGGAADREAAPASACRRPQPPPGWCRSVAYPRRLGSYRPRLLRRPTPTDRVLWHSHQAERGPCDALLAWRRQRPAGCSFDGVAPPFPRDREAWRIPRSAAQWTPRRRRRSRADCSLDAADSLVLALVLADDAEGCLDTDRAPDRAPDHAPDQAGDRYRSYRESRLALRSFSKESQADSPGVDRGSSHRRPGDGDALLQRGAPASETAREDSFSCRADSRPASDSCSDPRRRCQSEPLGDSPICPRSLGLQFDDLECSGLRRARRRQAGDGRHDFLRCFSIAPGHRGDGRMHRPFLSVVRHRGLLHEVQPGIRHSPIQIVPSQQPPLLRYDPIANGQLELQLLNRQVFPLHDGVVDDSALLEFHVLKLQQSNAILELHKLPPLVRGYFGYQLGTKELCLLLVVAKALCDALLHRVVLLHGLPELSHLPPGSLHVRRRLLDQTFRYCHASVLTHRDLRRSAVG